ncbi:MAG: hypothetical protein RL082_605 [Pseudomonadota bacterium]
MIMSTLYQAPEHEFEAQPGLPEPLPSNEQIIWQGSPDLKAFAMHAFHIHWFAMYFGVMVLLKGIAVSQSVGGWSQEWPGFIWALGLSIAALVLIGLLAYWSVNTTMYTLTNRRLVMRIGIVLTITFNLPLKRLAQAGVHIYKDGSADIPIRLNPEDKIPYLHLWPHAKHVASLFADAWSKINQVDLHSLDKRSIQSESGTHSYGQGIAMAKVSQSSV